MSITSVMTCMNFQECVACGTIYIDEKDAAGWMHLVPMPQAQHTTAGPSSSPATTRYDSKGKEKAVASNVSFDLFISIAILINARSLAYATIQIWHHQRRTR